MSTSSALVQLIAEHCIFSSIAGSFVIDVAIIHDYFKMQMYLIFDAVRPKVCLSVMLRVCIDKHEYNTIKCLMGEGTMFELRNES